MGDTGDVVCDRIDGAYYWSEAGLLFMDLGQSINASDGFSWI